MAIDNRALAVREETITELSTEFNISPKQVQVITDTYAKGCTPPELWLFFSTAKRRGLDPLAGQIHAVKRWSPKEQREVLAIQTGIDGLRLIADRTGRYRGRVGPYWKAKGGEWLDLWEEDSPPFAAKVGVYREGCPEPIWGVVKYSEFVQTTKEGRPNALWGKMPAHMLAKVAEAQALRVAFPQELSGVQGEEELEVGDYQANTAEAQAARAREQAVTQPGSNGTSKRYATDGKAGLRSYSEIFGGGDPEPEGQVIEGETVETEGEPHDGEQAAEPSGLMPVELSRVLMDLQAKYLPANGEEVAWNDDPKKRAGPGKGANDRLKIFGFDGRQTMAVYQLFHLAMTGERVELADAGRAVSGRVLAAVQLMENSEIESLKPVVAWSLAHAQGEPEVPAGSGAN